MTAAVFIEIGQMTGAVAQDKDTARRVRLEHVLPALKKGARIVLDFSAVNLTTQSFVHACISEAFRTYRDTALDLCEFKGCNPSIRNLVTTVIEYSMNVGELMAKPAVRLTSTDVPQADNLDRVRVVLEALARGDNTHHQIVERTGYSRRHVDYRLHSARVLGLVKMSKAALALTELGQKLVRTTVGSEFEREVLEAAILGSVILQRLVPDLLDDDDPAAVEVARRITKRAGLSPATAARRARALISWRRRVATPQIQLFKGDETDAD